MISTDCFGFTLEIVPDDEDRCYEAGQADKDRCYDFKPGSLKPRFLSSLKTL